MKIITLLLFLLVPILSYCQTETEPEIEFDNVRFSAGKIFSNIENHEAGMGLGLSTEFTLYKYLFATSFDFDLKTKKFVSLTFDYGAGLSQYISENMDMFIGISAFSLNLNAYNGGFNSAFLLKIRYKKLILEGKTTFWNWEKGKNPVLKENGYYGITYRLFKDFAAGVQYRLYAVDANFLNVHFGLIF